MMMMMMMMMLMVMMNIKIMHTFRFALILKDVKKMHGGQLLVAPRSYNRVDVL